MQYREIQPIPQLRPFIRCIWYMDRTYDPSSPLESLWPDGFVELIVHYGERYRLEKHGNPLPRGLFIGPLTRCTRLYTLGRVRLFGIRFYAWGFSSLFNIPMGDLQNEVVPLRQLLGPEASLLEERLHNVNVHTAADILQRWLVQKVKDATIPERKTLQPILSMYAKSGKVEIARLPDLTGLSLRQSGGRSRGCRRRK